jgi:hypothetical protein
MDAAGIDVQVLSLTVPGLQASVDAPAARDDARFASSCCASQRLPADYELRTARSKCTIIWVHICRFGVIMGGTDLVRSAPAPALGADQVPDMSSGCHVGAAHGRIASHICVAPNSLQRGRPRF